MPRPRHAKTPEVERMLAEGFPATEIAEATGASLRTIDNIRSRMAKTPPPRAPAPAPAPAPVTGAELDALPPTLAASLLPGAPEDVRRLARDLTWTLAQATADAGQEGASPDDWHVDGLKVERLFRAALPTVLARYTITRRA